jgi:hypothetical protein
LLGQEAFKLVRRYERLLDKHEKVLGEIHDCILEFGRKLQSGRDMYGPGKEFGWWVERRHLNTGKLCSTQQERTACMIIARLHDVGVDPRMIPEGAMPCRLDLTDCKRTLPTDIMKWARQKQPHLFPHLAHQHPKTRKIPMGPAVSFTRPAFVPDPIPDLASDHGHVNNLRELLDRILTEVDNLPDDLRAAITEALR